MRGDAMTGIVPVVGNPSVGSKVVSKNDPHSIQMYRRCFSNLADVLTIS